MIEFGLKHKGSSGWKKKFPRRKIERGDFKHLSMHYHFKFGYDRNYNSGYLSWKDLDRFFEANLGRNVNDVFSEYVRRAKRFDHDVNLKKAFYDNLDPNKKYRNKFCIDSQNRIAIFKEKEKKTISAKEAFAYNESHYPSKNIKSYLKENQIIPLGEFYLREHWWSGWEKKLVYICSKDWYDTVLAIGTGKQFIKMSNMKRIYIPFSKTNAQGVPRCGFESGMELSGKRYYSSSLGMDWDIWKTVHYPYSKQGDPDFLFFVKGDFKQY